MNALEDILKDFPLRYLKNPQSPALNYTPKFLDDFYNYNAPGVRQPERGGHYTDAGKMPGHPTFSNESIYADSKYAPRWKYPFGLGEELQDPLTQELLFSTLRTVNPRQKFYQ